MEDDMMRGYDRNNLRNAIVLAAILFLPGLHILTSIACIYTIANVEVIDKVVEKILEEDELGN